MNKTLCVLIGFFILTGCTPDKYSLQYDHKDVTYIDRESLPDLDLAQQVYVPAYSDIYYETENKNTYLTVVLSLRNISFTDTLYFDKIEYYNSGGILLKNYINKVLVLRPMESMEYIVREADKEGGAGANFVVSYMARSNLKNPPYIETIMMGNLDNYRFAFSSPGIPIHK
jgi:hypothetical protein